MDCVEKHTKRYKRDRQMFFAFIIVGNAFIGYNVYGMKP